MQLPGEAHDTELKVALGESDWTSSANSAGRAGVHTPPSAIDIVNASKKLSEFLKCPTAVQFPVEAHDTE